MKNASLIGAAIVVLVANALALLHVARNRSGAADAEIVLTDGELHYYPDADDTGVALRLQWAGYINHDTSPWIHQPQLIELGFDCSVQPGDKNAYTFYTKQPARTVFVALEYNGESWRKWVESGAAASAEEGRNTAYGSRLLIVDAALDPATLRGRYPARDRVFIMPAVMRVSILGPPAPGKEPFLSGFVQEISSTIHVPRPFSDRFHEPGRNFFRYDKREDPLYRVRLRYGSQLEPWVTDVEFLK